MANLDRLPAARFLKYPQCEEVMSNAGKLKGKNDGISPDLLSEILERGKKKMKQSVMADGGMKWFCNIDVMGEVKRLRQENLRLKDQIQALSKEVGQMKLLLQQSSIQLAGKPPTTANATPSREGEKSLSFLSDKHDELILFKTNAMAELERLGKKIEAVNEKVKNISEAIESMGNYSY